MSKVLTKQIQNEMSNYFSKLSDTLHKARSSLCQGNGYGYNKKTVQY